MAKPKKKQDEIVSDHDKDRMTDPPKEGMLKFNVEVATVRGSIIDWEKQRRVFTPPPPSLVLGPLEKIKAAIRCLCQSDRTLLHIWFANGMPDDNTKAKPKKKRKSARE